MAREVIEKIISDLSGKEGAETVPFAFDGTAYTIDLTGDEREKLRKALAPFIDKATPVKAATVRTSRPAKVGRAAKAPGLYTEVREAGRRAGVAVKDQGYPGKAAIAAWEAETGRSFQDTRRW